MLKSRIMKPHWRRIVKALQSGAQIWAFTPSKLAFLNRHPRRKQEYVRTSTLMDMEGHGLLKCETKENMYDQSYVGDRTWRLMTPKETAAWRERNE